MPVIKFGIQLPIMVPSYPPPHSAYDAIEYNYKRTDFNVIKKIALKAEELGYHSLWIGDHLSRETCKDRFEGWTILSALIPITKRIRLGNMVLCNMYRHPGLLSKMAATADVLSEGRLELGIGIGSRLNEDECRRFGMDFPRPKIRFEMLRESVEIIKCLWTEEKVTYHGRHYQINEAYCEPKPVQKPYPPITIGGGGEKVTLRIVARYADKSNFSFTPQIEAVARKLSLLKKYCQDIDRDYNLIEKTCTIGVIIHSTREKYIQNMKKRYLSEGSSGSFEEWIRKTESIYIAGTPAECFNKIKQYLDIGISHFIIRFGDTPSTNSMELFARNVIQNISGKGI